MEHDPSLFSPMSITHAPRHPTRPWVNVVPVPKETAVWRERGHQGPLMIRLQRHISPLRRCKSRRYGTQRHRRVMWPRTLGRWGYPRRLQLDLKWDKGQQLGGRWAGDRWPIQAMMWNENMSIRSVGYRTQESHKSSIERTTQSAAGSSPLHWLSCGGSEIAPACYR